MLHSNKIPSLKYEDRILLRSSDVGYSVVPLCYSEKQNVWFNYNCVCENTNRRIIVLVDTDSIPLKVPNGAVVFFAVQWTWADAQEVECDTFICKPETVQLLSRYSENLPYQNVFNYVQFHNYSDKGYTKLMCDTVYCPEVSSTIRQNFHVVYPVDENNVRIKSVKPTYWFAFSDDNFIHKEVLTTSLFPLGQQGMLEVSNERHLIYLIPGERQSNINSWFQYHTAEGYQSYKEVDNTDLVALSMEWDNEEDLFITKDVFMEELNETISVLFMPDDKDEALKYSRYICYTTRDAIIKKTTTLLNGMRCAVLSSTNIKND